MSRHSYSILIGTSIGLLLGTLAPFALHAAFVWDKRSDWSSFTNPEYIAYFVVLAIAGALNGSVGTWDGWRSRLCRLKPVVWVPMSLFLFPAFFCIHDPSDSKTWGGAAFIVCIMAPFVWVSGRIGQEIGVRSRNSHV
jgi:O-antigen/teichoic acid export membrane protein